MPKNIFRARKLSRRSRLQIQGLTPAFYQALYAADKERPYVARSRRGAKTPYRPERQMVAGLEFEPE